jgi:hypothetical protein
VGDGVSRVSRMSRLAPEEEAEEGHSCYLSGHVMMRQHGIYKVASNDTNLDAFQHVEGVPLIGRG